jgi:hypothetical protein
MNSTGTSLKYEWLAFDKLLPLKMDLLSVTFFKIISKFGASTFRQMTLITTTFSRMTLVRTTYSTLAIIISHSADYCHSAECHSAECHSAECHSAECHSAECHSAEIHSAEIHSD